ncbi:MAG: hypothetical protein ACRDRL_02200, partial [Sciscionella sp.]
SWAALRQPPQVAAMVTATEVDLPSRRRGRRAVQPLLRAVLVAGLAVDAAVHAHLAPSYGVIGRLDEATLFVVEAVVAAVLALLAILRRTRVVDSIALLVALAGLAAVVTYRYVDVGALGPFPDMYEPVWYPEKAWSAVAEGVAALAAIGLLIRRRRRAA